MTFKEKERLFSELKKELKGEVRDDSIHQKIYSTDASIYEVCPLGVVLPKDQADLEACVHIASHYQTPLIPRGAGTGIAGGCLGRGVILDLSKYLTKVIDIDWTHRTVTVEPGVVQDDLNRLLKRKRLSLGP